MRYVQLRAFHYVAICGGFSRAAEKLFLTQPAISDQVRKLEEQYDILLFNRRNKQVTLTAQGEDLLKITHRLFDVEQQALELLTESRALRSDRGGCRAPRHSRAGAVQETLSRGAGHSACGQFPKRTEQPACI